jgi:two-component system, LytTR family, sensor kinase
MTLGSAKEIKRPGDRLFWSVVVGSVVLIILTLIASQFVAAPVGAPPGARALPRVPRAPATTGELLRSLGVGTLIWYVCFVSAPLFIWMGRRLPFDRSRWPLSLASHLAAIALLAVLTAWLQYRVTYRPAKIGPPLGAYLKLGLITGTLPFLTVAAAAHALAARARAQERDLESERIRSQLAESRLEALTAQLQPHFLFNTLQGISTLITRDPVAADKMLTDLSDLLREVLRRGEKQEVELGEELRVLESYLEISRTRFGDRLSIAVNADEGAIRALVPFFILQPLVENALHHGISSHAGSGSIEIAARRMDEHLVLTVRDDGPGTVAPDAQRGIGLANTRARLQELYRGAHSLQVGRPADGGFQVSVTVPYREHARARVAP